MPCRGPESDHGAAEYRRERDVVTRMLCTMCRLHEDSPIDWPDEIADWWSEHKRLDRERKEREAEAVRKRQKEIERAKREGKERARDKAVGDLEALGYEVTLRGGK